MKRFLLVNVKPPLLAMSRLSTQPFGALPIVHLFYSNKVNLQSILTPLCFNLADSTTLCMTRNKITVGMLFLVKATTSVLLRASFSPCYTIHLLINRNALMNLVWD